MSLALRPSFCPVKMTSEDTCDAVGVWGADMLPTMGGAMSGRRATMLLEYGRLPSSTSPLLEDNDSDCQIVGMALPGK